jgi:hypothetical protein
MYERFKNRDSVDFRYGRTLSAGRAVSLLGRFAICGVSPVPLFPLESPPFTPIKSNDHSYQIQWNSLQYSCIIHQKAL